MRQNINEFLMGARKAKAKKDLEAARTEPYPELISIQKYIKSKPEKAYLDWKAEQQENQQKSHESSAKRQGETK